jgi:hypothetical protein
VVQGQANVIASAVQARNQQFGSGDGGHLNDPFSSTFGASFLAAAHLTGDMNQPWMQNQYWSRFVTPPGFDLTPLMNRGDAILLAWMPGESVSPSINQFSPRYSRKDTMLRVAVPIER